MISPALDKLARDLAPVSQLAHQTLKWLDTRIVPTEQGEKFPKAHLAQLRERLNLIWFAYNLGYRSEAARAHDWSGDNSSLDGYRALVEALPWDDSAEWILLTATTDGLAGPIQHPLPMEIERDTNILSAVRVALRLMAAEVDDDALLQEDADASTACNAPGENAVSNVVETRLRSLLVEIVEWSGKALTAAKSIGSDAVDWPYLLIAPVEEAREAEGLLRSLGLAPSADRLAELIAGCCKLSLNRAFVEMERANPSLSAELRQRFGEISTSKHDITAFRGTAVQVAKLCEELATQCGNDLAEPAAQAETALSQTVAPATESVPGVETPAPLMPAARKAYLSYKLAESKAERQLEDRAGATPMNDPQHDGLAAGERRQALPASFRAFVP